MAEISPAALQKLKDEKPCDKVARAWVALRRLGSKWVGPCPMCSRDRASRTASRFEATREGWVCAVCADGGDVIKLVRLAEGLDFRAAVDWLGGAREPDPDSARRLEARRKQAEETRDAQANAFRERERTTLYQIWTNAEDLAGSVAESYLALRGLASPDRARLRCVPDMPYWGHARGAATIIARAPAMVAPITRADGTFAGLHFTYLDVAQPKGKIAIVDRESGELLDPRKTRGSKAGNVLELVPCAAPSRIVIGEGIETVLSVRQALERAGRDLAATAFWVAVDLGNLGGKHAELVRHPTLRDERGRVRRVPGPVPDMAAPAIALPASVTDVVILGDGDSDPFLTRCAVARAAARWTRDPSSSEVRDGSRRTVRVAWAPDGSDFNDVVGDEARILQLVDAAAAPEVPAGISEPARAGAPRESTAGRRKPAGPSVPPAVDNDIGDPGANNLPADNVVLFAAAPRAPLPAASSSGAESNESSQTGASPRKADARKGSGRRATAKRFGSVPNGPIDDEADMALDRRLAFFPLTDLGNAERFRERNRHRFIWCAAIGWMFWDRKRWNREGALERVKIAAHLTVRSIQDEAASIAGTDDDVLIGTKGRKGQEEEVYLSDLLRQWGRDSESNSKLNQLADQAGAYLAVQTTDLDADGLAINVMNGTLIARRPAGSPSQDYIKLKLHDPRDLITKLAPVEYHPDAARDLFDRFIAEVQPNAASRRTLQQWKGLSLTGDGSEQKLAVFYGKGRNGKSVLEEVTSFVAGDYSETVPVETFLAEGRKRNAAAPSPDLALLPGVRMLRTSEPTKGARLDEGLIKLATGGEPIQARNLNLPFFKFYPSFKLTISGNHRPKIMGDDEGIWRRIVLVPWPVTIAKDNVDPKLAEKLRGEASGILNWMLDGLRDWLDHRLTLGADVEAATAEYRRDSDQLGRFLEACVVVEGGQRTQSSVLHAVFNAWSRANSLNEWKGRGFSDAMTERGFRKDKSSVMFFLDIRLTKGVSDFLDHEGNPVRAVNDGGGKAAARRDDDLVF